jgi:predicted dehydrogenase
MNVAIIGCGLIGRKRALALSAQDRLTACCDTDKSAADKFASEFSCQSFDHYGRLLDTAKCEGVVVAVVNKYAQEIVLASLAAGCHVLAEKPLGRNAAEAKAMCDAATAQNLVLKTGFNHRFHPAIWRAKELCDQGGIGKVFNIRARYGHGGRPGMEKEWRASQELCGGGELLDQGVHVIDLIRWFGGEVTQVFGKAATKFWPLEVEDNAFAILETENAVTASFHVSWTNWRNVFSFEIFGTDGYLRIEGLGGSYGPETLEWGKRKKEGGRPDIEMFEFPPEDVSWQKEWREFLCAVAEKRASVGSGNDGLKANEVIEAIYRSNLEQRVVELPSG